MPFFKRCHKQVHVNLKIYQLRFARNRLNGDLNEDYVQDKCMFMHKLIFPDNYQWENAKRKAGKLNE